MLKKPTLHHNPLWLPLALSTSCMVALFWYQGDKGFMLWDEGFFWYGVRQVILGEVPIRDFMSYDPGRYYWSAFLMKTFLDNDLISLRISTALFQFLGLFIGLLLIAQEQTKERLLFLLFLLFSSFSIILWMFPYYKVFDTSVSIFLIASLAYLIKNPTQKRYFISGFCLGLIACFGRNHGLYGVVGSLGVMCWLNFKRQAGPPFLKKFSLWCVGIAVGFSPVLFMIIFVPDFANSFMESIRFNLEYGSTNIPLPVPWPWRVDFVALSPIRILRDMLIGLGFVGLLAFGAGAIIWSIRERCLDRPVSPTFVAAAFLAFPYAHYAFSRADIYHLAWGIFPLLLGVLVLLATQPTRIKWTLLLVLCICSFYMTRTHHPWLKHQRTKNWVEIEVSGNILKVDQGNADEVKMLRNLTERYAPDGENILVIPFLPGAYPLLERKSPTWEIYSLFNRSKTFEEAEIVRISAANPKLVVLLNYKLDGQDDLLYQNTHPVTFEYIQNHFELLQAETNDNYLVYKRIE